VAILAVGALTVVGNISVGIVKASVENTDERHHDEALLRNFTKEWNQNAPVEERIAKREELIAQLKDKAVIQGQRKSLAALYDEQGQLNLMASNFTVAEQSFQTASELDPKNSIYLSDMAELYAQVAVRQGAPDHKVELLKNSTEFFDNALNVENDESKRRELAGRAADVSYNLGREEMKVPGRQTEAIANLMKAKQLAPGSQVARYADELILLIHR
jgi:tetratricopeptide (TPR) repeat protein